MSSFRSSSGLLHLLVTVFLIVLSASSALTTDTNSAVLPKDKRYPDIGKLLVEEAKLLYGTPNDSRRLLNGGIEQTWARGAQLTAADDWIANPYKRIPVGDPVDPTIAAIMILTFDSSGKLISRRFAGRLPAFGDNEKIFRKP